MDETKTTTATETPTLTLEPFAEPQQTPAEAAPQKPAVEPVKLEESALTPEEQKTVREFAEKIDINNSNLVLQYGADAQRKMANFSETALNNVRTKDLGEVGGMITSLVTELKNFDAEEEMCIRDRLYPFRCWGARKIMKTSTFGKTGAKKESGKHYLKRSGKQLW